MTNIKDFWDILSFYSFFYINYTKSWFRGCNCLWILSCRQNLHIALQAYYVLMWGMSGNSSPAIRQIGSLLTKQCEFGESWVLVDLVISKTYCIFIAQDKELRTLRQRASTVRDCSATRTRCAASLAGTFAFNNGYRPHMSIGYKTSSLTHQEKGSRKRMWKQKKYAGNLSVIQGKQDIIAMPGDRSGEGSGPNG